MDEKLDIDEMRAEVVEHGVLDYDQAQDLLSRLEQAEQAVARVRELGDAWKSRGEHSMKYSETLQWPVAEAIHEGGADMVNNANLIYRALDGGTRG